MTLMTLGQMTPEALIDTAGREALALGKKLDTLPLDAHDRLVVNAYIGSIAARCAVANDKLADLDAQLAEQTKRIAQIRAGIRTATYVA